VKWTTTALAIVAILALAGCSISVNPASLSSPTEAQVASLLRGHGVYAPECVKAREGSDRSFDCTGQPRNGSQTLRLEVTVAEDGKAVFINKCEPSGPAEGRYDGHLPISPCTEVQ
jgi:hypothetical protein